MKRMGSRAEGRWNMFLAAAALTALAGCLAPATAGPRP